MNKLKVILLLANKNLRITSRDILYAAMFLFASMAICGSLFVMWRSSNGEEIQYLTKSHYKNLDFEMQCSVKKAFDNSSSIDVKPKCGRVDHESVTPSDLLFDIIGDGKGSYNQDKSFKKISDLLVRIMMNGLPLLGLDDFVFLSDFVNSQIGEDEKKQLMSFPASSQRFGSFLGAREKEIRLAPHSCWTTEFVGQLYNSSAVAKVTKSLL
jgi:hypothetical protein